MLKTRKINKIPSSSSQQYGYYEGIYGQGDSNFIYGADALAQILTHQILTIKGEIDINADYGVNWFTKNAGSSQKVLLDSQIKEILLNNVYVNSIVEFNSSYTADTNTYNVSFTVNTTEGLLSISL